MQVPPPDLVSSLVNLVDGEPRLLHRSRGAVVAVGRTVVAKLHSRQTDPELLLARLEAAGQAPDCFLTGLRAPERAGDHVISLWPRAAVLSAQTSPGRIPWRAAGALLAGLHRRPVTSATPQSGAAQRISRALAELPDDVPRRATLLELGRELLLWVDRVPATHLSHGDWHLGQLAATPGGWRLIDPDDAGLAPPGWDLGRAAGHQAIGLLDPRCFEEFLAGYRDAGGPGVPPSGDPWPVLDLPARCEVWLAAVRSHVRPDGDIERRQILVDACVRMVR